MDAPDHALAPARSSGDHAVAVEGDGITIRPLTTLAEYNECVALQKTVWGAEYDGLVPASLLKVSAEVGGLVVGAFSPRNELCGFVFGLTGVQDGVLVHWSHFLGVRDADRNAGLGRRLKKYQRAELARRGIAELRWTFDPLVAKNAHLNLNVLGARVLRYVPDMYGTTDSPLHHRLATDRLVVAWPTTPDGPTRVVAIPDPGTRTVLLTYLPHQGDRLLVAGRDHPAVVWIEVPSDIQLVLTDSPASVAGWQATLRTSFLWALANEYSVTGLHRDQSTSRCYYILERGRPAR
jgi:predicted GNAT superfamily acetyltransferase